MNEDGVDALVASLESRFAAARLEKRGTVALLAAKITGTLYLEAVTAGVPHLLAQEMAQDFWHSELGAPAYLTEEDQDEDDADADD
ncbi:hypothetical protein [Streptomyces sp. NPDC058861]|uniref:hypothetical protein n=1 Tax=Streptomyces sp. NPDC058861 TaxID=3346653 RepID=UPI0036AB30C0